MVEVPTDLPEVRRPSLRGCFTKSFGWSNLTAKLLLGKQGSHHKHALKRPPKRVGKLWDVWCFVDKLPQFHNRWEKRQLRIQEFKSMNGTRVFGSLKFWTWLMFQSPSPIQKLYKYNTLELLGIVSQTFGWRIPVWMAFGPASEWFQVILRFLEVGSHFTWQKGFACKTNIGFSHATLRNHEKTSTVSYHLYTFGYFWNICYGAIWLHWKVFVVIVVGQHLS